MSRVTNIILTAGLCDEIDGAIKAVESIDLGDGQAFRALNNTCYGGSKSMECLVFAAAVNKLNRANLAHALRHVVTERLGREATSLRLMVCDQTDEAFHLLMLDDVEAWAKDDPLDRGE